MARIDTPQTTQEPWLEYLGQDASPAQRAFAQHAWMQGYRPTWNSSNGTYEWNNDSRGVQGQPAANAGPIPSAGGGAPYFPTGQVNTGTGAAPAAGAPPSTPAAPSAASADQVYGDSEWLQHIGQFAANRDAILTNYGAGVGGTDAYGNPLTSAGTWAAAANNPHSVLQQLMQQRQGDDQQISNQLGAHHAQLGGAAQQTHMNEGAADETRHTAAAAALQNQLTGVANSQDNLYWNIYHRLAANPSEVTPAAGDPATAGSVFPNSLPVPGNTSDAGGVRTVDGQRYINLNPLAEGTEKRAYNPLASYRPPTIKKPKRPPSVGTNARGGNAIPTGRR